MKNWPAKFLIYTLIAILSIIGFCCYALLAPVVSTESGYVFYLRPGISKRLVIQELAQQGLLKSPRIFFLYTYTQNSSQLKTGEYLLPKGSSAISIWRQVTTGRGLVYHPFAIIPGWTFTQLRNELTKVQELHHVSASMSDQTIMQQLGAPNLSPEGEFYPETYYYTKGISDFVILKRAFNLMQLRLKQAVAAHPINLPYHSAYDALIVASLIEKEAYLNAERPMIAGVIINRMNKDMLLQIDATVIYGLGARYDGKIYKSNLLEDTPFNTYVHKGLPPTPIAMPSQASIEAAFTPQKNDFLYYVARGDGSHQFSKTLVEHNAAVHAVAKNPPNLNESFLINYQRYSLPFIFQNKPVLSWR